jgi:MoxR-vWA-beta-propeller ternary system domain bpX4
MTSYFYNTIYQLRSNEEIILYDKMLDISEDDEELVKSFLLIEYDGEKENYPYTAPAYDANAALWAAKIVYTTSQLMLYREHKIEELKALLPEYEGELNASAILSSDLCLRFLPQILNETKYIDPDDELISLVEKYLKDWHYSSIGYPINADKLAFDVIASNKCLQQMYVDRIITRKDAKRATFSFTHEKIKETMGDYAYEFWNDLKTEN